MNNVMKKALTSLVFVLAFAVCSTAAFAGILKRPYMIYPGNGAQMEVLWQDTQTETTNTIVWGTDPTFKSIMGSATVPENNSTANQHMYTITGLAASTKYYYEVADATNGVYGSGSFLTAPPSNATSVQFIGLGDTRTQPTSLNMAEAEVNKFVAAHPSYQGLAIHDGDWVSTDGEANWTNEWFSPAMTDSIKFLSQVPVNGCKGNHEDQGGWSIYFPKYYPFPYQYMSSVGTTTAGLAELNNFYWSYDYGPVHFTMVDQYSEQKTVNGLAGTSGPSVGSTQYNWLVNDLSSTTKPWKVLIYHEPAWNSGTHTNNQYAQNIIDPLVKQYNVDVVYTGHSHNYTRCGFYSTPLTPTTTDTIVPNVAYITEGDSGAPQDAVDLTNKTTGTSSSGGWRHIILADPVLSYMTFDVEGKTMTMKAYAVTQANGSPVVGVTNTTTAPSYSSVTPTASQLIETVVLNHFTDITSKVTTSSKSMAGFTMLTITNPGPAALTGTIDVALNGLMAGVANTAAIAQNNGLTPGITLVNATGQNNGAPMIQVTSMGLAAGASITVPLKFSSPTTAYTPVVLGEW